jgi:hypothetical protein
MALTERLALTLLCRDLEGLRAELTQPGHPPELLSRLDALLVAAKDGRPVARRLSDLVGPFNSEYRSAGPLPGLGSGRADREQFDCPMGRCDLVRFAEPAGALPRCQIFGRTMPRREPA